MYTYDYFRLTDIFEILAYPFLFVLCVCFYLRWLCYTREQVML